MNENNEILIDNNEHNNEKLLNHSMSQKIAQNTHVANTQQLATTDSDSNEIDAFEVELEVSKEAVLENFMEYGLSAEMAENLYGRGFKALTPIQQLVIPEMLSGEIDIIGQAKTGTGKTAAFAVPILEKLIKNKSITTARTANNNLTATNTNANLSNNNSIKALILSPTRELALQICEEIKLMTGRRRIKIVPVFGGSSIDNQIRLLSSGNVDIVVGTPGRIMDLIDRKCLKISSLDDFVLDEADEMLNMGFIDDVKKILSFTNQNKRMLFFSATMPPEILSIAKSQMGEYKILKVESKELTIDLVEQFYCKVNIGIRLDALCRVLDKEPEFYGIIFCKTKSEVDEVTRSLKARELSAESLHGDMAQYLRTKTLALFKDRIINILVATDVAARGIDVNNLTHVINFNPPSDLETYIHRIGRTGRAGKKGIAITFAIDEMELNKLYYIQRSTGKEIKKFNIPNGTQIVEAKKEHLLSNLKKILSSDNYKKYLSFAKGLVQSFDLNNEEDPTLNILAAIIFYDHSNELDENAYKQFFEPSYYSRFDGRRSGGQDSRSGVFSRNGQYGSKNSQYGSNSYHGRDRERGNYNRDRNNSYGRNQDDYSPRGQDSHLQAGHQNGTEVKIFIGAGKNQGYNAKNIASLIASNTGLKNWQINQIRVLDEFSFAYLPKQNLELNLEKINQVNQANKGREFASIARR